VGCQFVLSMWGLGFRHENQCGSPCVWISVRRMVYHPHLSCSASEPFIYATPSCVFRIEQYFSLWHLCTQSLLWPVPSTALLYSDGLLGYYTTQDVVCQPLLWKLCVAAFWRRSPITITEILLTLTAFPSSLRALTWSC